MQLRSSLLLLFIIPISTIFYAADTFVQQNPVEFIFNTLMLEMETIARTTGNHNNELEAKLTIANTNFQFFTALPQSQKTLSLMLGFACTIGTPIMLQNLLENSKITKQDCAQQLITAVLYGNVDVVRFMMDQKIDILNPDNIKTIPELERSGQVPDEAKSHLDGIYRMMKARYSNRKDFSCPFAACRKSIDEALIQKKQS